MVIETYLLNLFGEVAIIERKEGKYSIVGYDLESERVAHALTSNFGSGMGFLLLALDEIESIETLEELFANFANEVHKVSEIMPNPRFISQYSPLTYSYLSFSPNPAVRRECAKNGAFSQAGWKRLLNDPSQEVLFWAVQRATGPTSELKKYLTHPDQNLRANLAMNHHLSLASAIILANDKEAYVREKTRYFNYGNPPLVIRKILAAKNAFDTADDLSRRAKISYDKAVLAQSEADRLQKSKRIKIGENEF